MEECREAVAWIWVSMLGHPINKIIGLLENEYGSVIQAFKASEKGEIGDGIIKYKKLAQNMADKEYIKRADDIFRNAEKKGMKTVHRNMPEYPAILKELPSSPAVLYCFGNLPYEIYGEMYAERILLSVVGSRNCSAYGYGTALRLSTALAKRGFGIVSGMARGIDTAAHRAALDSGGYTIAVLGCGADVIYPKENVGLYEMIKKRGCIISEFPPGTPPVRNNFPARNRIIAALSYAVTVVEAGQTSGAMITAGIAADIGRDVFAVPGNIDSPLSFGCNKLIQNGALCVTSEEDILSEIGFYDTAKPQKDKFSHLCKYEEDTCEFAVYSMIRDGVRTTGEISEKTGIPAGRVQSLLA
ncbi:MAG: DNA-processing protein DprA, partial [Clostridia bacterium]|nr:DNA-processing protein DprA [Clostridia bacterium]